MYYNKHNCLPNLLFYGGKVRNQEFPLLFEIVSEQGVNSFIYTSLKLKSLWDNLNRIRRALLDAL